jgi:hypothetical protein
MKRLYWWLTFSRWKAGSDDAFDAVLECLDFLERRIPEHELHAFQMTADLRFTIKQMKDEA